MPVLGLGYVSGGVREMMGEASIPGHVGTVPNIQPMQIPNQVLQLLVLVLTQAVFEAHGFGFDFLCGAARCFVFRVEVI